MNEKQIISYNEIQQRLNWTLLQKIDHSLGTIESFLNQFPNSVISFSGGIDSVVMLFLVRMIDKNRKGVFVNTTNEFSEIINFVKCVENIEIIQPEINFIQVVEKYGFPLISKQQARIINTLKYPTEKNEKTRIHFLRTDTYFKLSKKYEHLIYAPFDISDKCCYYLKKKPFNQLNKQGALVGIKATDSQLRTISYQKFGCINVGKKQALPLSIWTKDDIWNFIKQNSIPYCNIYDKGEKSTGCAYCGFGCSFDTTRFARLKEREPKRYKIMMSIKNNGITYAHAIKLALNINIESYIHPLFLTSYQEKLIRK
ncbi:MAG: phosphoadenosine phosphosulfate reductase family protein [Candidatus Omnitrophica bacterium]|jgi:3'-phosphoadenosine 5'-phosphosulfate sulfotransferase (PAPS reductase)/FAD synthetase|nr:phosphoadenosine phosphosulfate reductase family protein [Candidatus Omnitrophota bacterium]